MSSRKERSTAPPEIEDMKNKNVVKKATTNEHKAALDESKVIPEPTAIAYVKERLMSKVALVTGAASGIGRGIAYRLAKEGAKVSIVDINIEEAKKVAKEIEDLGGKSIAIQCDVGEEDQVIKTVEETEKNLRNIDILVNDAGIFDLGKLSDLSLERWKKMFKVHVEGTFLFCKAVLKNMKQGGRIINISSISGIMGDLFLSSYSSAKAAIIGFTKSLALEVAHKGITVNAIAPGAIQTIF
ncbi:MAG: SDR family NAD(P)-dependent oxidoreductase [Candidatus Jordarchaeaceae archaeon]